MSGDNGPYPGNLFPVDHSAYHRNVKSQPFACDQQVSEPMHIVRMPGGLCESGRVHSNPPIFLCLS